MDQAEHQEACKIDQLLKYSLFQSNRLTTPAWDTPVAIMLSVWLLTTTLDASVCKIMWEIQSEDALKEVSKHDLILCQAHPSQSNLKLVDWTDPLPLGVTLEAIL